MNEKNDSNQMTKARWTELCAQHLAQSLLIGELRAEVSELKLMLMALAASRNIQIQLPPRNPEREAESGLAAYREFLKATREGLAGPTEKDA
jgi:hypothetical protein